jgi:hypothetical protein
MLTIMLVVAGCGGDGMVSISGEVLLDNVKIEKGNLKLAASDSPVAGSEIVDGQFKTRTTLGKKIATIYALKLVGEVEETEPISGKKVKTPKYAPLLDNGSMYGELTTSYEIDVKKNNDKFTINLSSAELLKK